MKSLSWIRTAFFAWAMVFSSSTYADPKIAEQIVGPVAEDAKYVVSPQGAHLATVARKGSRMMVTVDGVAGPKVDEVLTPVTAYIDPRPMQALSTSEQQQNQPQPVTFSKDGNHFAYVARVGQEWLLMQDNKEVLRLPAAGLVGATTGIAGNQANTDMRLQFAVGDGKHLFFAKSSYAGYELWLDGQKLPGYFGSGGGGTEGTVDPLISPDGAHFAYMANMGTHPGDKRALIVDGKDAGYVADNLQLSPDGRHLIGIGRTKEGDQLLVDGKSLFKARGILGVYLAPIGNRLIAVLQHANPDGSRGAFLLVDGKPVEASGSQQIKKVVFSPDGKRYAAICGRPGAEFVITDGKKGQEYSVINPLGDTIFGTGLTFSADSSKVGYIAAAAGKYFIVINDDESDAFENVAAFLFTPDGKHVVMHGKQGQSFVFIMDGKVLRLPPNTGMQLECLTFSPDQSRYAFFTGGSRDGGPVFVDGKETGLSGTFNFSPDSKHVAIVGYRSAENKAGLFIDGALAYPMGQGMPYRAFSPDSQHLFWMSVEPVTTPNPADNFEMVTYTDGKPVAHNDRGAAAQRLLFPRGFGQFDKTPPAWSVGADGALTLLAPSPEGIKRIKATPGADTSLATILQAAQAAEAKAKAEADPKFQQEKRDREVAEYRRKVAEAKAARLAEQKRAQEQQPSGK